MTDQVKSVSTKKRGRPATGKGLTIGVRLQPNLLARLDAERARHDPEPSRPEMIRQMVEALMLILEKDPERDSGKR